jgi:hypothetical protein
LDLLKIESIPDKSVEKMYFCARKGKSIKCTDWTWMCPDKHLSCWDKFHSFYLPAGVFHTHATSNVGDKLIFARVNRVSLQNKKRLQALKAGSCNQNHTKYVAAALDEDEKNSDSA